MTTLLHTLLVGTVSMLVLLLPGSASAGTRTISDADDATGRLDVAAASHGHAGTLLEHTIRMQRRWPSSVLAEGTVEILFRIGDRYRTLDIEQRRRGLVGEICTETPRGSFRNCSDDVDLSRPDRFTLQVTLARGLLRKAMSSYRWRVVTLLDNGESGCTDTVCLDQARDDDRWVRHRL
jgi:hypothetical protein